jgi:hypothetical protein
MSAAYGLGIHQGNPPKVGLLRAALLLFKDESRIEEARALAGASAKPAELTSTGYAKVTGEVEQDLADTGGVERAYAIRVGLAIAAGLPRDAAEDWAKMHVRSIGRPRKVAK